MKLEVKRRKPNMVSPFINGWNVWDIPEEHWTLVVQQAITHAYELGVIHARESMSAELYRYRPEFNSPIDVKWEETT